MIETLQDKFDANRISNEIKLIFQDDQFSHSRWADMNQISFKRSDEWDRNKNSKEYWFSGVGSLYDFDRHKFIASTSTFTQRLEKLEGSYIAEVMDEVEEFARTEGKNIGRVRVMRLMPKTCYTLHVDPEEFRYHIPLLTNLDCFFVVGETMQKMPEVGRLYRFKTNLIHTAVNASPIPRLHLVFDTF